MNYKITILAMGSYPEINISQKIYENLKKSTEILSAAFAIEEKYELLFQNFIELEKKHLEVSLNHMLKQNNDYKDFFDIRLLFNQKIVNLLTSTKLYNDQIFQHVKVCISENDAINAEVKSLFSEEYDNCFEYRFMEALRNYVQHRGLAVHSTSLKGKKIENDEDWNVQYKVSIFSNKIELEKDNAFKKNVLNEMDEKVDLIYAARVYIESLNKIHNRIRNFISSNVSLARSEVLQNMNDYKMIYDKNPLGLYAIKFNEEKILEKVLLLLDWDDIRLKLEKSNSKLLNLRKRYITNNTID